MERFRSGDSAQLLCQCISQGRRKKLRAAARHILGYDDANRHVVDADVRAQCSALGIDADKLVPPALQRTKPKDCEVWPEHWDAVQVFMRCQTQWRMVSGMGGVFYMGFDYSAVTVVMRYCGVRKRQEKEVFAQFQILENEALGLLNSD